MGERQVRGEVIQQFLKARDVRPELMAAQLEMSMTALRQVIKTGRLPKRRQEWRLSVLSQITGLHVSSLVIEGPEQVRSA